MLRRYGIPITLFLLAVSSHGQSIQCVTDPNTPNWIRNIHRGNRAALGSRTPAEMRNGLFLVPRAPDNSLGDHPNDLEGKSVRFVPTAADRYTATVGPLQYDTNVGTTSHLFVPITTQNDWQAFKFDLKNVKLSLFGQSVSSVYVTAFNGITLSMPSVNYSTQFDTLSAAFDNDATISPLLIPYTRPPNLNWPTAYVRETSDGVLVTWRALNNTFNFDVQASIRSNGEILFSYKTIGSTTWGAAVITPGSSAFLPRLELVGQSEDAAGDVDASFPASLRNALDLRSIAVEHVAGTGGYLIFARLAADPRLTLPPRGDTEVITFTIGNAVVGTLTLGWNGMINVTLPDAVGTNSGGGDINGDTIELVLLSSSIDPITNPSRITVETSLLSASAPADRATIDVPLSDGPLPGADLSAANGAELQLPIVDAFTVPTIDLQSVWESVRAAASLSDGDIDGVAIFSNFNTEVVLRNAAYATIGNSGDDGIWKYVRNGSRYPRAPNLMQMNVVGVFASSLRASQVLMHEFGHRWLQFVETMENGSATIALNPQPAHPPQFASAPAAFTVVNSFDTSTMGGGYFTQSGSTFTASAQSPNGYSWFDLYLMGLAAPEEVPAMYVIDNSNPALGPAYNPPSNAVVTGTRHDLTIQQVIDAMGPRKPSSAASRHAFKVAFVLVYDPTRPFDDDFARLDLFRTQFADMFTRATGQRASVTTLFGPPQGRKKLVR